MMITPYNLLRHELIGLHVHAIPQKGPQIITGKITGETRDTFKIKTTNGEKTVIKKNSNFRFELPKDAIVEVEGKLLIGRPQDRIKNKNRIKY